MNISNEIIDNLIQKLLDEKRNYDIVEFLKDEYTNINTRISEIVNNNIDYKNTIPCKYGDKCYKLHCSLRDKKIRCPYKHSKSDLNMARLYFYYKNKNYLEFINNK
jgi:hypothetical protein